MQKAYKKYRKIENPPKNILPYSVILTLVGPASLVVSKAAEVVEFVSNVVEDWSVVVLVVSSEYFVPTTRLHQEFFAVFEPRNNHFQGLFGLRKKFDKQQAIRY